MTGSALMQSEKTEALSVTLPVELTRLIKIFITKMAHLSRIISN